MDILIKNAEMPINCCFCLFKLFSTCILKERIKTKGYHNKKRHPKCPLIPVPEHGDLIDRDALANSIPEAQPDGFENCGRCTCMTKDEMVEIIMDAVVVLERTT